MAYTCEMAMLLPLPFRRGEGRSEGSVSVVYPAVPFVGREKLVAAVLRWFEEGRLSQGKSAAMLGMKRGQFFDVLHDHRVSPVQMSVKDLEEDFQGG